MGYIGDAASAVRAAGRCRCRSEAVTAELVSATLTGDHFAANAVCGHLNVSFSTFAYWLCGFP